MSSVARLPGARIVFTQGLGARPAAAAFFASTPAASIIAGSVAVAACVWGSGEWGSAGHALGAYTIKVAAGKAALAPGAAVCSGILCNVLVCLAILAAASSKQTIGKILAIWFPIMAFVLGGFEHSVANMYYLPAGLMARSDPDCAAKAAELGIATGALTVAHAARNLLFVTIGNLIGGMVFVGALWGSIAQRAPAKKA